jgi:hypothetical protein
MLISYDICTRTPGGEGKDVAGSKKIPSIREGIFSL